MTLSVELIEETLQSLLQILDYDKGLFYNMYRSLPYELYKEIEKLSVSKSETYKDLCIMAKKVTTEFHNNPKFIDSTNDN